MCVWAQAAEAEEDPEEPEPEPLPRLDLDRHSPTNTLSSKTQGIKMKQLENLSVQKVQIPTIRFIFFRSAFSSMLFSLRTHLLRPSKIDNIDFNAVKLPLFLPPPSRCLCFFNGLNSGVVYGLQGSDPDTRQNTKVKSAESSGCAQKQIRVWRTQYFIFSIPCFQKY